MKNLYVYAATQYDFGPQYQQQRINIKYKNAKWHLHSPAKRFRALQFAMHRDGGLIGLLCEVIPKKLNSSRICGGAAKHYDYHGKTDLHTNLASQTPAVDFTLRTANKNSGPWLPAEEGQ